MRILLFLLFTLLIQKGAQAQLVPFRLGDLWGYSDTSGQIVIQPEYAFTEFFDGAFAFVKTDSCCYRVNLKGKIVSEPLKSYGRFEYGLCPVQDMKGRSWYINLDGKQAFPGIFDAAENYSEGLAVVSVNKKLGIINTKGSWVRHPDFDTSSAYYKSGFLMGVSKGKYFYIDKNGQTLQLADSVKPAGTFSEGLAAVYVTKQYNSLGQKVETPFLEYIDSSGRIVLSGFKHDGIDYSEYIAPDKEFRDGKAIIKARNEMGWDYYFIDRRKKFSPLYSAARHLGDSLFLGAIGYYMSDVRIVDSNYFVTGQFQQKPTQIGEFGNGLIPFRNKEGNWGYVNSNCRLVIKEKYSAAFNFRNGYAIVVVNGRPGYINTYGKAFFHDLP